MVWSGDRREPLVGLNGMTSGHTDQSSCYLCWWVGYVRLSGRGTL